MLLLRSILKMCCSLLLPPQSDGECFSSNIHFAFTSARSASPVKHLGNETGIDFLSTLVLFYLSLFVCAIMVYSQHCKKLLKSTHNDLCNMNRKKLLVKPVSFVERFVFSFKFQSFYFFESLREVTLLVIFNTPLMLPDKAMINLYLIMFSTRHLIIIC